MTSARRLTVSATRMIQENKLYLTQEKYFAEPNKQLTVHNNQYRRFSHLQSRHRIFNGFAKIRG